MIREISNSLLLEFLQDCAPDQVKFVTGSYFDHGENIALGWFAREKLVGCVRYCVQEIGMEQRTPPIVRDGSTLTEGKINAFAVDKEYRNRGIGKQLQLKVIEDAQQRGCSQITSYSTYDKVENYAIKVSLGFCIQPETQPSGVTGCYFLKKLPDEKS